MTDITEDREVDEREQSILGEIAHHQTFAEKYLESAHNRPHKALDHIKKVQTLLHELDGLVKSSIKEVSDVEQQRLHLKKWTEDEFTIQNWLDEYEEKADIAHQEDLKHGIDVQTKDDEINFLENMYEEKIRQVRGHLWVATGVLEVIDRRNQRDAPIHERISLGRKSSRRNVSANMNNVDPREDFPPLRHSPREDSSRNTAGPREGGERSRDREISELRKQISDLQRERWGETSHRTSEEDQSKNGGRAQQGLTNNNVPNQEDIRNYIQTAMETLQGFATQLNLQTNTGMTHSDK